MVQIRDAKRDGLKEFLLILESRMRFLREAGRKIRARNLV
jgi:hypothetical protein